MCTGTPGRSTQGPEAEAEKEQKVPVESNPGRSAFVDKEGFCSTGEVTTDRYGRKIPKHAHGTANLQNHTSSAITVVEKTLELYDRIINPDLLIRRIYVTACHVRTEQEAQKEQTYEQMSLFDFAEETEEQKAQKQALQKEKQMQKAMLSIKQRYGKNAILKGTNFKEGATMRQRNGQIGGHRA